MSVNVIFEKKYPEHVNGSHIAMRKLVSWRDSRMADCMIRGQVGVCGERDADANLYQEQVRKNAMYRSGRRASWNCECIEPTL